MIPEEAYRTHMRARDLAANTIETNIFALRRIERDTDSDLAAEFARDQLTSLIERLTYTREDEQAGRPNPTGLTSDPSRLFVTLGWYRGVLVRYREFLRGGASNQLQPLIEDVVEDELQEAAGRTFKLEQDLQGALRANIGQIEEGLIIADGGREYKVAAGYIDILARDRAGCWVVIELKAGDAKPDSIAQILSYMSCITDEKGTEARGLLVASDFVPRVRWAARSVSALSLKKYSFSFLFQNV